MLLSSIFLDIFTVIRRIFNKFYIHFLIFLLILFIHNIYFSTFSFSWNPNFLHTYTSVTPIRQLHVTKYTHIDTNETNTVIRTDITCPCDDNPVYSIPFQYSTKVAVCLAAQLRGLDLTAKSISKYVIGPLNADLFIYGTDGDRESIDNGLFNLNVRPKSFKTASNPSREEVIKVFNQLAHSPEFYKQIPGNGLSPFNNPEAAGNALMIYMQHHECFKMLKEYETANQFKYDIVVFLRPDMEWLYPLPYIPVHKVKNKIFLSSELIDDRFAYMSRDVANIYFGIWDGFINGEMKKVFQRHFHNCFVDKNEEIIKTKCPVRRAFSSEYLEELWLQSHGIEIDLFPRITAVRCSPFCTGSTSRCWKSCDPRDYWRKDYEIFQLERTFKRMMTHPKEWEEWFGYIWNDKLNPINIPQLMDDKIYSYLNKLKKS